MIDLEKIEAAITLLSVEKKIPKEKLIEIIEAAIKTAYKRDFAHKDAKVEVHIDLAQKTLELTIEKTIVETVTDPSIEIALADLGDTSDGFSLGDTVEIDVTDEIRDSEGFGRIASQAAKQVIVQKLQESEKEKIYNLFRGKEGTIINLKIEMVENNRVIFDHQGNQVVLPKSEQVSKDRYAPGNRMYLYVSQTDAEAENGPKVTLTRKDKGLVAKLFEMNVPEIEDGTVEIVAIARIPGFKTKIIVASEYDEVDAAGSLIGPKGIRVKTVVDELFGEKIDVISYTSDMAELVKQALMPGSVEAVEMNEEAKLITCHVRGEEKPKILGKAGANINLATELLGYQIRIETIPGTEIAETDY